MFPMCLWAELAERGPGSIVFVLNISGQNWKSR